MRFLSALPAALLLCVGTPLLAQPRATITGTITDSLTGAPLAFATVQIADTQLTTNTDTLGRYTLPNVPPGLYTIRALRLGYTPVTLSEIRFVAGATVTVDFRMANRALTPNVSVTAAMTDPASGMQTGTITGTVIDSIRNVPLSLATVQIVGTDATTRTDTSGHYTLRNIPPGIHSIRASRTGYAAVTKPDIRVTASDTVVADFRLPTSPNFSNAVISGRENPFRSRQVSTVEPIKKNPGGG